MKKLKHQNLALPESSLSGFKIIPDCQLGLYLQAETNLSFNEIWTSVARKSVWILTFQLITTFTEWLYNTFSNPCIKYCLLDIYPHGQEGSNVPVCPLLWKADAKPWILLGCDAWGRGCFFIQSSSAATDPTMKSFTTALKVWVISALLQASLSHRLQLAIETCMSAIPLSVLQQATITLSSDHFCLLLSNTSSSLCLHELPFARNW